MTMFVALALLMTLAAVAVVLLGVRAPTRPEHVTRGAINVAVARQQLQELALERARGVIPAADFEAMRDDLQRRLLQDAQSTTVPAIVRRSRWATLAVAALLPIAAALIYASIGSPSALTQADAPLTAQLEAQVVFAPGDARAWVLLARQRMDADQFEPAAAAYARALEQSRKVSADAQVWAEYADALGMAQGGTLAGKPHAAIERALALDPRHPKALELAGSAAYEARDFRAAHAHWRALLDLLPPESPQRLPLAAAVEKVERLAQFALPAS